MKKVFAFVMLATISLYGVAQTANNSVIKISGTRLAYPVVQKWIDEYSKTHAGVQFELNSAIASDSADVVIAAYFIQPSTLQASQSSVVVSRYVQLPIANSHRNNLKQVTEKGFTEKDFKDIYFSDARNSKPDKYSGLFTVYTREKPACATVAFASHFGSDVKSIHGVGVKGDDKSLLAAVQNDSSAISYNNLGFIYDTRTRSVVDGIAIVPIDLNENGKVDDSEKIYSSLDNVVDFAERTNHAKIPVENVNAIYNKQNRNEAAIRFLQWVLAEGQQYNHGLGFLQLADTAIDDQLAILLAKENESFDLDALYGKQN